jgi:hypothetical protein
MGDRRVVVRAKSIVQNQKEGKLKCLFVVVLKRKLWSIQQVASSAGLSTRTDRNIALSQSTLRLTPLTRRGPSS